MSSAMDNDIDAWCNQLERLERVLMCVGPDEVCCQGMTPRQTSILRILIAQEGARLSDLAAASRITPSAMTRVIEKLEKQGMARRVRGAQDDGRAAIVEITPTGRKARRRIDQLMRDRARAVAESFPESRRAEVLRLLQEFSNALESSGCCGLRPSGLTQLKGQLP
ncbi:MAG: MarR family winged helix-turn-helix transcriptional regulator [Acidobacteriia bacterium]|nr:MarR family winged helix-turn-helix transcriptional regulator [Terriglobia bacterium]